MTQMTMGKALGAALAQSLADDPKVVLLGEDIGKLGGVFRITDGLLDRFGPERVIDTPLAESGIVPGAYGQGSWSCRQGDTAQHPIMIAGPRSFVAPGSRFRPGDSKFSSSRTSQECGSSTAQGRKSLVL